jgi:hypothetical protein
VKRVVRIGLQEHEILLQRESRVGDAFLKFHNTSAAVRFLRLCEDDRRNESVLRGCLADLLHSPATNRYDWKEICEQLAYHLMIGNIRIITSAVREPQGGSRRKTPPPPPETPPETPPVTPAKPVEPVTPAKWVEFQVAEMVGDEEKIRNDVTLRIKFAERAPQTFSPNDQGVFRIEQITAGSTCDVQNLEGPHYFEVTEVS